MTAIDRAAALREDILAEPASLARLLDAWERADGPAAALDAALAGRPRLPLLLVGMGSSRFAAMTMAAQLNASGGTALVEWASTPSPMPPDPERVVIAISASGRTPETVAAAERHRGTSPVIAVTERSSSPLAAASDLVLPLLAGPESGGVACRTHLATLATLLLVAGRRGLDGVTASRLRPAVDGLAELIASTPAWLGPVADLVDGAPTLQVVGDAGRPGAAEQAALMLREGPRLPATAWDAGDWAHVGIYTVLPGTRVVLLSGTAYDRAIVETVRSRSAEVVAVGPPVAGAAAVVPVPDAGDPLIRALVEVTVAELLAAELWARAEMQPVA